MSDTNFIIKPETISIRLGKSIISGLRREAMNESIRKGMNVTVTDIIKESLKKSHPELFSL